MNPAALPSEPLRRRLAEIGVPRERHALRELARILPAGLEGRPFDEMTPDAVAEVLIYLADRGVLNLAACAEPDPVWGEQRCRAYRSPDDLLALVVPYFAQGLSRNERCLWVAPASLASLIGRQEDHRLRDLRNAGDRLEIIDCADWQPDGWAREHGRTLAQGYAGLRVSGDLMHVAIGELRIKALCTHPL